MITKLLSLFSDYIESVDNKTPNLNLLKEAEQLISSDMEFEEYRWAEIFFTITNLLEIYKTLKDKGKGSIENIKAIFLNHIEELLEIEDK